MNEKITVMNRTTRGVVCDEQGHSIAPGLSRAVGALDAVAAAGLASGELTLETPVPDPGPAPEPIPEPTPARRTTKNKAAKATENEE